MIHGLKVIARCFEMVPSQLRREVPAARPPEPEFFTVDLITDVLDHIARADDQRNRLRDNFVHAPMRTRDPTHTGSIAARVLVRFADHVAARGHDAAALCRRAGLQLAVLRQPDARVPYALAAKLGERAVELTRDPNLGLHLAQDVRDSGRYDPGVLLLAASPTVRAALEHMVRYQRYWGDGERSRLVHAANGLVVRDTQPLSGGVTQRHNDECVVAELVLGLRVLTAALSG